MVTHFLATALVPSTGFTWRETASVRTGRESVFRINSYTRGKSPATARKGLGAVIPAYPKQADRVKQGRGLKDECDKV